MSRLLRSNRQTNRRSSLRVQPTAPGVCGILLVAASLQTNPDYPAIEATSIQRDANILVFTSSHEAKPGPLMENGAPIWAVISLVSEGGTLKVAQMLERSQTIKRGTGQRQPKRQP